MSCCKLRRRFPGGDGGGASCGGGSRGIEDGLLALLEEETFVDEFDELSDEADR